MRVVPLHREVLCTPLQTSVRSTVLRPLQDDRRLPTSGPHDEWEDVVCPAGVGGGP